MASSLTLTNTILWGNTASIGNQVHNFGTGRYSYSLIQDSGGSGGSWDTSLGIDGGGNIDGNPLFARIPNPGDGDWTTLGDNDYGDLHLEDGSPAINSGTNLGCPVTDLEGHYRPIGPYCDIGVYESRFGTIVNLPLVLR
jgi:hypothetical protein